jgi:hypothetical protein
MTHWYNRDDGAPTLPSDILKEIKQYAVAGVTRAREETWRYIALEEEERKARKPATGGHYTLRNLRRGR